jgi:hypothetical protein
MEAERLLYESIKAWGICLCFFTSVVPALDHHQDSVFVENENVLVFLQIRRVGVDSYFLISSYMRSIHHSALTDNEQSLASLPYCMQSITLRELSISGVLLYSDTLSIAYKIWVLPVLAASIISYNFLRSSQIRIHCYSITTLYVNSVSGKWLHTVQCIMNSSKFVSLRPEVNSFWTYVLDFTLTKENP